MSSRPQIELYVGMIEKRLMMMMLVSSSSQVASSMAGARAGRERRFIFLMKSFFNSNSIVGFGGKE